jgi:hypothetical protein
MWSTVENHLLDSCVCTSITDLDPDPALSFSDFQDATIKLLFLPSFLLTEGTFTYQSS